MVFDHTVEFCPGVKRNSLQVPFKALREKEQKKMNERKAVGQFKGN